MGDAASMARGVKGMRGHQDDAITSEDRDAMDAGGSISLAAVVWCSRD
jgi:hypothetical protein